MSTIRIIMAGIGMAVTSAPAMAGQSVPTAQALSAERSGQQDFDWELGTWATRVRVLRNPLSGEAPNWAEYRGTSLVRPLLAGRANAVELSVEGPAGRIEGVALRLYNPQTRQWNINYAGVRNGMLTAPIYGGFNGSARGTFYGQDMLEGRAILVRFVITRVSANEARFEQAYSADGGTSWEVNWIAVDTRR